jgi:hypothetical protein
VTERIFLSLEEGRIDDSLCVPGIVKKLKAGEGNINPHHAAGEPPYL